MVPWAQLTRLPKRHLDRFIRFCTVHSRACLYFTMGRPLSPKFSLPVGGSGLHLLHGSLSSRCPPKAHNPNSISIGSACFARLTTVRDRQTDRQTDRPRYLVCNNRPHLRTFVRSSISSYTPTLLLISAHSEHSEYTHYAGLHFIEEEWA